jgi:hypothetical protein
MTEHTPKDIFTLAQKRRHIALLQKLKDGKSLNSRELSELRFFEQGKREKLSVLQRREIDKLNKTEEQLLAQEIGPLPVYDQSDRVTQFRSTIADTSGL